MTPPTILSSSTSYGLNPISIGPRNGTIQVRTKFVLKWSGWCIAQFYPLDFTQNSPNDSTHNTVMFPKFWTQSDINWSMELDNFGSYEFYPLDSSQNSPNDSSHHIMMFPKFWTQSDIDWSMKWDNSVLSVGFHSKLTKLLLPPYYDVLQVLDSIRYRLVHEIEQFSFIHWISLKTHQMTPPTILCCSPNFGLNSMSFGPWNWTTNVRTNFVLKWSGYCIALFWRLGFTQNPPNDSSHHITMFPKFWTKSDTDWSMKLDNSGSYEVRSEMEWLVYCFYPLDFTQNSPNDSAHNIVMFPKFWTQSDIDWSMESDNYGSYEVRSVHTKFVLKWSGRCIALFQRLDFTQTPLNDSSHHIVMFPKFWTQYDIDWSKELDNSVKTHKMTPPSIYGVTGPAPNFSEPETNPVETLTSPRRWLTH
ncbi:unnamed protein product [Prunus armeniaca]